MAEQTIGLRIQLNGMNTVIQDIDTFEKLLKEAKEDLRQIPIGSNNFKQLQKEIKAAEGQLGKLKNEQTQLKKEFKDFGQIGSAITGAFAGAAAAMSLLGSESTAVSKAQQVASQALTVVLSAQAIAQLKLGQQTIATTISQRAQTIATNTSNVALKALFTTIAANPVGALIAVLGLAVAALMAFGDEADTTEAKTARLNTMTQAYINTQNDLIDSVKELTDINVLQMEAEGKSLEEINKYRKKMMKTQMEYTREAISAKKVEVEEITKLNIQRAEAEDKTEFEIETIRREGANKLAQLNREFNKTFRDELVFELKLDLELEKKNAEDKLKKQQEYNAKLKKVYDDRVQLQMEYLKALGDINNIETNYSDETIQRAEKLLGELKKLQDKRRAFFTTDAKKFTDELSEILFEGLSEDDFKALESALVGGYNTIYDTIVNGQTKLLDEQGNAISFSFDNIKNIIDESTLSADVKKRFDELTKTQQIAITQFFTLTAQTAERYSKELTIADKVISISDTQNIQKNLTDLIAGTRAIFENDDILPGDRAKEIKNLIESIFTIDPKTQKDFVTAFDVTGEQGFKNYQAGLEQVTANLTQFAITQATATNKVQGLDEELSKVLTELTQLNGELTTSSKLTAEQIDTFTTKLATQVKGNINLLDIFIGDVTNKTEQYIDKFGKEGIIKVLNGLTSGLGDIDKLTRQQLNDLLNQLISTRDKIETEFGDGTAEAFDNLIDKIKGKLLELPPEIDENFVKTLEKIEEKIQVFQQTLGQIGTLISDQFSFQLEKLEFDYERALNGVVGDTKLANQKRLELEEGYQEQKKQIEKKARLTSLRITLAETLASGAQAVVSALKLTPPASFILAGINGTITGLQTALIAQQIALVQQYRRGGMLALGGLVSGPSHEYGGVQYANGGVELEGNEAVINRQSTIRYGNLLSTINQAQGGRPIMVGNSMDSRLIEVLAKQKQEPIRAYVIEQDITQSQNINRKLEQLASF